MNKHASTQIISSSFRKTVQFSLPGWGLQACGAAASLQRTAPGRSGFIFPSLKHSLQNDGQVVWFKPEKL